MDWNHLLGKRSGRVTRKPFWIATIAIYSLSVFIVWAGYYTAVHYRTLTATEFGTIVNCLISVQFFLMCPLIIKRLHDRDRSGWWLVVAWIAPQAFLLLGLGYIKTLGTAYAGLETAGWLALVVIVTWALIELGFRRGTEGPNRFGVNPLPIRLRSRQLASPATVAMRAGLSFGEPYAARLQESRNRFEALHPLCSAPLNSLHI